MKKKIVFLVLMLRIAFSESYFLYAYGPIDLNSGGNLTIQSLDFAASNFVYIAPLNSSRTYLYIINTNMTDGLNYLCYNVTLPMNNTLRVKTFKSNSFSSNSNAFLIFSYSVIQVYKNSMYSLSYLYPVSNVSG